MASGVPVRVQPWKSLSIGRLRRRADGRPDELGVRTLGNSFLPRRKTFLVHGGAAVALALASTVGAEQGAAPDGRSRELQQVVDALRTRMGIDVPVAVTLVDRDPRILSVRRSADATDGFALSAERGFVESLTAEQIEAALAHELGHVWIYTHHPYLQTEQLANRVAMRAVSRERLVEVYRALWGPDALHGSLEAFLGVETAAPTR
jgi:hypothetical protein